MYRLSLLFLILFGLISQKNQAQLPLNMEQYAKDLYKSLETASNDSLRATIYFNLVTYWTPKDSLKTFEYLEKGHEMAHNSLYLKGLYYAKKGYYYYSKGNLEESEKHYLTADSFLNEISGNVDSYKIQSDIWNNIAVIHQIEDEDEKFVDITLNKAIPFAEKAKDDSRLATLNISLGIGFMNLEQYEKAIAYLLNAEKLLLSQENQNHRLISMYNRIAESYVIMNQTDEAKNYIDKAREILKNNPDSDQKSIFYLIEGLYFQKNNQFNSALNSYNKALTFTAGPNKTYHIYEININKVALLLELKRFNEALQLGLFLEKDPFTDEVDTNKASVYKHISDAYLGLGKTESAYDYLKKYSDLNIEIHDQDFKEQINDLELKYDVAQKEKALLLAKSSEEKAQFNLKNSKLITALSLAGVVILLLTTLITFNYYRNNKRRLRQNEIIHQQKIKEKNTEAKLAVKNAVLESEEQERQRIAQDLHDSMGGMLANIRMSISQENTPNSSELLEKIDKSIVEMRRISRNLMPETLKNLGLEIALKELCESMSQKQFYIQFEAFDLSENIPFKMQLSLYRIVQESISNVIKYAQAGNVIVQISQHQNTINLTIEDDGIGFDTAKVDYGLGIKNIENRTALMNGTVEILSEKGKGTTINVECYV
ncbi:MULTISPECIES: tetratricopeptide repeat-containing sensor histidine kinase [unclassified Myroides]|uniref:tetratricopeptide repeat-containing sensor histidine kinase n=1 Tax=unclassified Myroides TaxID=2642485 RepID=UPI003D2F8EE7